MAFLPTTKREMEARSWAEVDFVFVTGDAYVDHPSFGTAIISRVLERYGYKVAILAQPNWKNVEEFKQFGRPRLGFLVNSGNVDSMVNHYSVFKNKRKRDVYSPGGKAGNRPDRAIIVYCNLIREAYKGIPILIGGLEASLRRFAHYDYWDDKVRKSILMDSKADILMYGMGERSIVQLAEALDAGINVKDISWIEGTCIKKHCLPEELDDDIELLPSFESVSTSKDEYCRSFVKQYRNTDHITAKRLAECYGNNTYVIQNVPQAPLEQMELDDVYALEFERNYHPKYEKVGGVPAINEVKYSVTSNRGCFGGCAFCAIVYHQGRQVRARSHDSIIDEVNIIKNDENFKGYIHDIGGPSANFTKPACEKQLMEGVCSYKDCLYPKPCGNMNVSHSDYVELLRKVRSIDGIKKVFIRSGIRYDYVMADKDKTFLEELCKYHVSGTLKVAPEHVSPNVLKHMRKPSKEVFDKFTKEYKNINEKIHKKQYLIPYLISSHPGSTLDDAIALAEYLNDTGFIPDQVQDFYPTPGTLATTMYYTEKDPFTMKKIYVAKTLKDKKMQRALIHFHKKENRKIVIEALKKARREDLINKFYKYSKK